jgi:hypothetical protein
MFATGLPTVDAQDDFRRARRAQLAARAVRWMTHGRRPNQPRTLCGARPSGAPRSAVIPLSQIVGTVEPSPHFDSRFRPASPHLQARWVRVALAHRMGRALPPINVLEGCDGYYVVDGRHRVSVALATGRRDIDARIA